MSILKLHSRNYSPTQQYLWVQQNIPAFKSLEHISSTTQRSLLVNLGRVTLLKEIVLSSFYHVYLLRFIPQLYGPLKNIFVEHKIKIT